MFNPLAIFSAEYLFVLPVLIGVVYFFLQSSLVKKRMFVLSIISLPLTLVFMFILNCLYQDARPETTITLTPLVKHIFQNGFPSTHATLSALIASILYIFNRKVGIFLFLVSIIISLSRVYLDLHHWIDIVGAMILAIVITVLSQAIVTRYFKNHF